MATILAQGFLKDEDPGTEQVRAVDQRPVLLQERIVLRFWHSLGLGVIRSLWLIVGHPQDG